MLQKPLYVLILKHKNNTIKMLKEPSFALIVSAKTLQEKFLRIP
jgi:hypothetical protein